MRTTATISTKGRYFDTLPLALRSIANQTVPPEKIIVFDDNEEPIDLRKENVYQSLFAILNCRNIKWEVVYGGKCGQVYNHQKALEIVDTELKVRLLSCIIYMFAPFIMETC